MWETRVGSKNQKEGMWEPELEVKKTEGRDVGTRIGNEKTEEGDVGTRVGREKTEENPNWK